MIRLTHADEALAETMAAGCSFMLLLAWLAYYIEQADARHELVIMTALDHHATYICTRPLAGAVL